MRNKVDKIFEEWLFGKDKSYNPFTKALGEMLNERPEVPMPEISKLEHEEKKRDFERKYLANDWDEEPVVE